MIPTGTESAYDGASHTFSVKGPKGELSRKFFHPAITITLSEGVILFETKKATMREKKRLFTFAAHARNMLQGATEGFTYKLKICSGHFPMGVAVKGNTFEVKNFIGEKVPRILRLKEGADVKVEGADVTVTGTDREIVGQVAADIEQLTRRPGFDTRVFQDGIFIVEKAGRKV